MFIITKRIYRGAGGSSITNRPAMAGGAVNTVVDSGVTSYGLTQPGEEWCVAACDVW